MTLEIKKVKTVLNNVENRKGLSAKGHGVENRKELSPKCHGAGHLPFILRTKCCLLSDAQFLPQPPKVGESVCCQGVFFEPQTLDGAVWLAEASTLPCYWCLLAGSSLWLPRGWRTLARSSTGPQLRKASTAGL